MKPAGLEALGIREIAPHPAPRAFREAQQGTRDATRPCVAQRRDRSGPCALRPKRKAVSNGDRKLRRNMLNTRSDTHGNLAAGMGDLESCTHPEFASYVPTRPSNVKSRNIFAFAGAEGNRQAHRRLYSLLLFSVVYCKRILLGPHACQLGFSISQGLGDAVERAWPSSACSRAVSLPRELLALTLGRRSRLAGRSRFAANCPVSGGEKSRGRCSCHRVRSAQILPGLIRAREGAFEFRGGKERQCAADRGDQVLSRVPALVPRSKRPFTRATAENDLAILLQTLGERQGGRLLLEEAVAAYREALKEWTRVRAPVHWATTENNLGLALAALGQREADVRAWKRRFWSIARR